MLVLEKKEIIQEILGDSAMEQVSINKICTLVSKELRVKESLLFGKTRQMDVVLARHIAMFLSRDLTKLSLMKTSNHAKKIGFVAASDAFFPFSDGPELLIDAGIQCIVQPGGSVRDQETIDICNKNNVTLLHTGIRRFRH